ncbi:MAG: DUF1566 domain-containing protein [Bacteroidetes bacterium]|nr:DUF1566 domain-containing protein [Bacteroidota bacterium]
MPTGASGQVIGTGQANTTSILAAQGSPGSYAATVCDNYAVGAYSDWFLPSRNESYEMYLNRAVINATTATNGGTDFVTSDPYWSSSETFTSYAFTMNFDNGDQNAPFKEAINRVRAIHTF